MSTIVDPSWSCPYPSSAPDDRKWRTRYEEFLEKNHWPILKSTSFCLTGIYPTRPKCSGESDTGRSSLQFSEVFKRYTQAESLGKAETKAQRNFDHPRLWSERFLYHAMEELDRISVETKEDRQLLAHWRSHKPTPEYTFDSKTDFDSSKQMFLKEYDSACKKEEAEQERLRTAEREYEELVASGKAHKFESELDGEEPWQALPKGTSGTGYGDLF